ncbi:glycoside hydrolase superfamily [Rhizoctonia solani]|nr:glycoside hydrolase superfamily [Rhizoctonia solani]
MRFHTIALGSGLLSAVAIHAAKNGSPADKAYGVNLGGWLLSEPWMNPKEWLSMGGKHGLVQKLGQTKANEVFAKHWSTWFTQENVDEIAAASLNSVRIPLGYWIVESLVDRSTEFYPRGGMKWLKNGVRMLEAKGIHVLLDHHALPGVSTPNQMFAGRCTSDVQFYTEKNYRRALIWAGVMTILSHVDPDFGTVFAIEAVNEPIMDASKTTGYGDYQKRFVKLVRVIELGLGIRCDDADYSKLFNGDAYTNAVDLGLVAIAQHLADLVLTDVLITCVSFMFTIQVDLNLSLNVNLRRAISVNVDFDPSVIDGVDLKLGEVAKGHGAGRGPMGANGPILARRFSPALESTVPHGSGLERHSAKRRLHHDRGISISLGQCYNNPPNPADAAIGPQLYDAHLFFSFGGVADPNAELYLKVICNTDRVTSARAVGNSPLVFGEWSLATNFNASREFMHDWADAQRHIYAGQADVIIGFVPETYIDRTYFGALKEGYFGNDPSKLTNPNVCDKWVANNTAST